METITQKKTCLYHPGNIRWGAILGGWVVATAAALVLYAIGTALGINVIQITDINALSRKTALLTGIWLLLTWIVALYLGGLYASRSIRDANKKTGALHAVGVWAVSNVMTIMLGISGVGITGLTGILAAGQVGEAAGKGLLIAAPVAAEAMDSNENVPADYLAKLKYGISDSIAKRAAVNPQAVNESIDELDGDTLVMIGGDFLRGDKEAAKSSLAVHTSLSREEAGQVVDALSAQTDEVKARLKEAAEKAAVYTASVLWACVIISLLALQAAVMGGRAGSLPWDRVETVTTVYRGPKEENL